MLSRERAERLPSPGHSQMRLLMEPPSRPPTPPPTTSSGWTRAPPQRLPRALNSVPLSLTFSPDPKTPLSDQFVPVYPGRFQCYVSGNPWVPGQWGELVTQTPMSSRC